jgi:hypothetical protein
MVQQTRSSEPVRNLLKSQIGKDFLECPALAVRLCSPFNFVQSDPEFIEGSLSLSEVEGAEPDISKIVSYGSPKGEYSNHSFPRVVTINCSN